MGYSIGILLYLIAIFVKASPFVSPYIPRYSNIFNLRIYHFLGTYLGATSRLTTNNRIEKQIENPHTCNYPYLLGIILGNYFIVLLT
jgi:hypothetical protein